MNRKVDELLKKIRIETTISRDLSKNKKLNTVTTNNSPSNNKFWTIIILFFTFSVGILLGVKLQTQQTVSMVQSTKIEEVLRYAESWYVEDVDRAQLIQKATQNILNDKTTFSQKVTSPELEMIMPVIDENFEGSGIDVAIFADSLLLLKSTKIGDALIYKPY